MRTTHYSCCGREREGKSADVPGRPLWLRLIIGRSLKRTLMRALVLGLCCAVVFKFALRPAWTDGISMEPTVMDHRLHFINLLAYRMGEPRRHDIVAIGRTGAHSFLLKRVLGMPGEKVQFRSGQLYVDGRVIEEPYVKQGSNWDMDLQVLGKNQYYVAGDNRSMSIQSHVNGPTWRRYLKGKLIL